MLVQDANLKAKSKQQNTSKPGAGATGTQGGAACPSAVLYRQGHGKFGGAAQGNTNVEHAKFAWVLCLPV